MEVKSLGIFGGSRNYWWCFAGEDWLRVFEWLFLLYKKIETGVPWMVELLDSARNAVILSLENYI